MKDAADQDTGYVIITPPLLHTRSHAKERLSIRSKFGSQILNKANLRPMQTQRAALVARVVARRASRGKEKARKETGASLIRLPSLPNRRKRPSGALMD